jgi:hypothetical protein
LVREGWSLPWRSAVMKRTTGAAGGGTGTMTTGENMNESF